MRTEMQRKIKILLIDDNQTHLNGIREILNMECQFDVVGASTSANIALALAKKYRPDIILMDMNMPNMDGLQTLTELKKLELSSKVIGLSGYDDADLIFRAMKLGAKGYVLKTMASAQLIYAIEEVASGKVYLPPVLATRFFEYFETYSAKEEQTAMVNEENLLEDLTPREEDVLELLTQGVTYKGVAGKLFISETTVKTHVNNIFQKLQVNDRTQAVLYAINNGFTQKRKSLVSL
ncbi:response regulator transcription factor [bacterium]|nr:response regulator transcription factor [bacterium]